MRSFALGDPNPSRPWLNFGYRTGRRSISCSRRAPTWPKYSRENEDGSVTVNALVTPSLREYYESLGFQAGATIEDRSTWEAARADREATIAAEKRSLELAAQGAGASAGVLPNRRPGDLSIAGFDPGGEIMIMRVDYFTNYAGQFLSVAAWTSLGKSTGGPSLALAWKEQDGSYGSASTMSKYVDDNQYMYHRLLVRVGAVGARTTAAPALVRVASSTGAVVEGPVHVWVGGGLPPVADGYLKGFVTHYMDPVEAKQRINALAAEFPDLAEIVNLPYLTNGYQRKAMGDHGRDDRRSATCPAAGNCRRRWCCSPRPGATRGATTSRPSSWTPRRPTPR